MGSTRSDVELVPRISLQWDTIKEYRGYIHILVSVACLYRTGREICKQALGSVQQHTDSGTIVDPVEAGSSKRATNNGA